MEILFVCREGIGSRCKLFRTVPLMIVYPFCCRKHLQTSHRHVRFTPRACHVIAALILFNWRLTYGTVQAIPWVLHHPFLHSPLSLKFVAAEFDMDLLDTRNILQSFQIDTKSLKESFQQPTLLVRFPKPNLPRVSITCDEVIKKLVDSEFC